MRQIWIISDTHFGHENIIGYCNRPFDNALQMDDFMLTAWNETVADQDIVYHLGDVYMGAKGREILPKLKGRKRLILGNHDNGKDQNLHSNFQKIGVWRMWPEYGVLLTHVPVHASALTTPRKEQPDGLINCHGHIHNKLVDPTVVWTTADTWRMARDRYYNACVEWHNYKPFPIEQVKEDIKNETRSDPS